MDILQIEIEIYGCGIQSFLLYVLGIALSVASVPTASYSVASSLYASLHFALITMPFDGTSIHFLHTRRSSLRAF